jgi:hypothetical protein
MDCAIYVCAYVGVPMNCLVVYKVGSDEELWRLFRITVRRVVACAE